MGHVAAQHSTSAGTRIIIDHGQSVNPPHLLRHRLDVRLRSDDELIGNMKKGQGIAVLEINSQGQTISLHLPLNGFGKAYDGPPTEPKVFESQRGKLHNELERRAEEVRQRLEGHQP